MNGIIGKKIGMTSIFNEDGRNISCTIVEATPVSSVELRAAFVHVNFVHIRTFSHYIE